jgi:Putative prokaryotic signal transducing protein
MSWALPKNESGEPRRIPNHKENAMAKQELVTVFTATNEIEAAIVKNALTAEGIRTVVEGGRQAGEVGLLGIGVKVQVPAEDVARARAIIDESQRRIAAEPSKEEDDES